MSSSTHDKVQGTAKEMVGKVKEKTGETIKHPDLRARGTAEKVEGKVQKKVGDVKKSSASKQTCIVIEIDAPALESAGRPFS
jgi:uncharacterized protein YjbJ (UPF0337 family)